ncbi:ATPase involved in chromosome partitioning [Rubidibacter lacunae KORDI 51-2]|uniref:ATPase involved in chromosome partitioning n=1 Tax=Rubidibacter lacunae KORDI 51-2 TaxID=582515 RepID=U5DKI1_9CHRO|nr:AAA family ATPase [Rubidibacter lacunae]ERN41074.1 ATPase involved in chromosome partitioning [Rubidibacter lacunae KORDI 51-2]
MANFKEEIADLLFQVRKDCSESALESEFVKPLLRLLGYSESDWSEQAYAGKCRIDFLIATQRPALTQHFLIVEVKAPRKSTSNGLWQLHRYLRITGSVFGLLTNGLSLKVLYNHNGEVCELLTLDKNSLHKQSDIFRGLLCKHSCERVVERFEHSNRKVHAFVLSRLLAVLGDSQPLLALKYKQNPNREGGSGMIVTVFNNKGGVGKTTLTLNLGAALNRLGKRVLLIDIDPQANLTQGLGVDPLSDVEKAGKMDVGDLLLKAKVKVDEVAILKRWKATELSIVPSHIRLSYKEPDLLGTIDVDNVLAKKLKEYKNNYDFVLIDPPPSFGKVNNISLMASDSVLIPTQLAPYPIRALEYVMDRAFAVDDAREKPLNILGIAVSMFSRASSKVNDEMRQEIYRMLGNDPRRKEVGLLPESTWIPQLNVVSTNSLHGKPLSEFEFDESLPTKDRDAALDALSCYKNLAKHLLVACEPGR